MVSTGIQIKGTTGIVLLVVISVVLFVLIIYAIYVYIQNCKNVRKTSLESTTSTTTKQKYTIIDYPNSTPSRVVAAGIKTNTIQPPYQANIKVKLIPSAPARNARKSIRYLDLSEDELDAVDAHSDIDVVAENNPSSPNIGQSISRYKDRITEFMRRRSEKSENLNDSDGIWKPEPVVISLDKRNSLSFNNLSRLQRPDSALFDDKSLGRITFTLYYSASEEYLTLLLISGRQIHSCDPTYDIRLPAVSVIIESSPYSEVNSNPDEAPNPEYDQEFTFTIRPKDLYDVSLRFTIWDSISNNETRVVGFFRVKLSNYQKNLFDGMECGPISKEIQQYLSPPKEAFGHILVGLLYDCVTDKILVTIHQCRDLSVTPEDIDIYLKVSLLLDNDVITSKRSVSFTSSEEIGISQRYEFCALSTELDKMSTVASPTLQVAEELLTNASLNYKKSLILDDVKSVKDSFASDTLRNHMGILISVRASTGNKNKRVIGRLYIGKTNIPNNDEQFHWNEMIRNFDSTITQWHNLRLEQF